MLNCEHEQSNFNHLHSHEQRKESHLRTHGKAIDFNDCALSCRSVYFFCLCLRGLISAFVPLNVVVFLQAFASKPKQLAPPPSHPPQTARLQSSHNLSQHHPRPPGPPPRKVKSTTKTTTKRYPHKAARIRIHTLSQATELLHKSYRCHRHL